MRAAALSEAAPVGPAGPERAMTWRNADMTSLLKDANWVGTATEPCTQTH
jgi:hypothetical protein